MNEYGAIVRTCMMKSFAGVMRPARKVIEVIFLPNQEFLKKSLPI